MIKVVKLDWDIMGWRRIKEKYITELKFGCSCRAIFKKSPATRQPMVALRKFGSHINNK